MQTPSNEQPNALQRALEALCNHFDLERERQETMLSLCEAQGRAARAHDLETLEARTEALNLLIEEGVEAEAIRHALLVAVTRWPDSKGKNRRSPTLSPRGRPLRLTAPRFSSAYEGSLWSAPAGSWPTTKKSSTDPCESSGAPSTRYGSVPLPKTPEPTALKDGTLRGPR